MSTKNTFKPLENELENPAAELLRETLEEMQIAGKSLANAIGIPAPRISEILNDKLLISHDNALRFAKFFGTDARSWLNLQNNWLLQKRAEEIADEIDAITPAAPVA